MPFAAGLVLLVPARTHAERAAAGIDRSYADSLRVFADVSLQPELPIPLDGSGAVGGFEPAHHPWFPAYLFAFAVVLLPLARLLLLGQRKRSSSPARTSAAAPAPSPAVT